MAAEQFVKFYQEWLPTKPDLETQLNSIGDDQKSFAKTAVDLGSANGFQFSEGDVRQVMAASQAKYMKEKGAELSEADLASVAGGALTTASLGTFNVSISKISSPINADLGKIADYAMCCW